MSIRNHSGHFQFAKYVDGLLATHLSGNSSGISKSSADENISRQETLAKEAVYQDYLILAVEHYLLALTLDMKHVYHTLPRLLSLWFELTSIREHRSSSSSRKSPRSASPGKSYLKLQDIPQQGSWRKM